MAHDLELDGKNGKASFFGVKEQAWHGLGTILNNPATAKEAIEHANLGFDVLQKPVEVNVGTETDPHYIILPNKMVNYRSDNNSPLGVVGSAYTPLQNNEAFSFFDALVEEDEAVYHSAGVLGKGEKIWIMAKMPTHVRVGKDDIIDQYVLLSNSHDGSSGVTACITPVRVVCNNTLTFALRTASNKISIRHTSNVVANVQQAHKLLELSNLYAQEMDVIFNQMAKIKVSDKEIKGFLDILYPLNAENETRTAGVKIREGIMEALEVGAGADFTTSKGTLFGFYNAVTFYSDHMKEYADSNAKMKAIAFGGVTEKKRQLAFDTAIDYMGGLN